MPSPEKLSSNVPSRLKRATDASADLKSSEVEPSTIGLPPETPIARAANSRWLTVRARTSPLAATRAKRPHDVPWLPYTA